MPKGSSNSSESNLPEHPGTTLLVSDDLVNQKLRRIIAHKIDILPAFIGNSLEGHPLYLAWHIVVTQTAAIEIAIGAMATRRLKNENRSGSLSVLIRNCVRTRAELAW
jgi:hypothetical protein